MHGLPVAGHASCAYADILKRTRMKYWGRQRVLDGLLMHYIIAVASYRVCSFDELLSAFRADHRMPKVLFWDNKDSSKLLDKRLIR
jgi:hypothetical protein